MSSPEPQTLKCTKVSEEDLEAASVKVILTLSIGSAQKTVNDD